MADEPPFNEGDEITEDAAPATTAVATYDGPRLPYSAGIEKKYGINIGAWKVLCEAIYPAARTPE